MSENAAIPTMPEEFQPFLDKLFPPQKTADFFDALYGEAEEGAYDIHLVARGISSDKLSFGFELHQRPGKCLACNLTYGLPQVFQRHPIINVAGLAKDIADIAGWEPASASWKLGRTEEISNKLHIIPLELTRNS